MLLFYVNEYDGECYRQHPKIVRVPTWRDV